MNNFWEIVGKVFEWIWITFLFLVAIIFYFYLEENAFHTHIIGSVLIGFLGIRRVLRFFGIVGKGNPYILFLLFLIGISLPLVAEYSIYDPEKAQYIILLYFLFMGWLIYEYAKSGRLGERIRRSVLESDKKGKINRQKQKNDEDNKKRERQYQELKKKEELEKKKKELELEKSKQTKNYYCKFCGSYTNHLQTLLINRCGVLAP